MTVDQKENGTKEVESISRCAPRPVWGPRPRAGAGRASRAGCGPEGVGGARTCSWGLPGITHPRVGPEAAPGSVHRAPGLWGTPVGPRRPSRENRPGAPSGQGAVWRTSTCLDVGRGLRGGPRGGGDLGREPCAGAGPPGSSAGHVVCAGGGQLRSGRQGGAPSPGRVQSGPTPPA